MQYYVRLYDRGAADDVIARLDGQYTLAPGLPAISVRYADETDQYVFKVSSF